MSEYTTTRSDGCVATGNMVDGKVDGTVTVTYPSGQTKSLTYYNMNIPVGFHQYWKEDGTIEGTVLFDEQYLRPHAPTAPLLPAAVPAAAPAPAVAAPSKAVRCKWRTTQQILPVVPVPVTQQIVPVCSSRWVHVAI